MTLTASEICAILEMCGKSGVRRFEGCGLVVEWGISSGMAQVHVPSVPEPAISDPRVEFPPRGEELPDPVREQIQKELMMDELAVTDPARYEELMLREVMNGSNG